MSVRRRVYIFMAWRYLKRHAKTGQVLLDVIEKPIAIGKKDSTNDVKRDVHKNVENVGNHRVQI